MISYRYLLLLISLCTFSIVTSQTVTQWITINSVRYATLDNVNPKDGTGGLFCSPTQYYNLPTGWSLASKDETTQLAIWVGTWATNALVLQDGSAWLAGKYQQQAGCSLLGNTTTLPKQYHVFYCDMKILISQPVPQGVVEPSYIRQATQPVNIITLNGIDFATADDSVTVGAQSNGCQAGGAILPTGWKLATEESIARAMLLGARVNFATPCVSISNGTVISTFGQNCSLISGADSIVSSTAQTMVKPKMCPQRVLISRASILADTWSLTPNITSQFAVGDHIYATLDNAAIEAPSGPYCQNYSLKVPEGWSIASRNTPIASLFTAGASFGSWCFVLNDSTSLDRSGIDCNFGFTDHLMKSTDGVNTYYAVKYCDRKILLTRSNAAAKTFTIGMKIGVLTVTSNPLTEVTLGAITTVLNAFGTPYELVKVSGLVGNPPLEDAKGNPKYYALILTNDKLVADGQTVSALNAQQWNYVDSYKYRYGVRLFSAFSYLQSAEYNMTMPADGSGADTYIKVDPSAFAQTLATEAGVNTNITMAIKNVWYYGASVKAGATNVSPLFRYVSSSTAAVKATDPVGAIVVKRADKTEEMHFFFDSADWTLHGMVLGPVWLKWVTRNRFIGYRRVYFSCQVDDFFLSTETFTGNPELEGPTFRLNGTELPYLVSWMADMNRNVLPKGSNFTFELGFNGDGAVDPEIGQIGDWLWQSSMQHRDSFLWLSHTWSHLDLTCPDSNCTEYGATTYAAATSEMFNNVQFAERYLFHDSKVATYSANSMITPKISGLFNNDSLRAIRENGVFSVVGDNTRPDLQAENWYQGFYVNEGIFVIPRYATRIGYDNSLPEETAHQQNYIYGPGGLTPYYDHDLTFAEVIAIETERVVPYLLAYRHDPYMFHQANLRLFKLNGKDATLISHWSEDILKHYVKLMTLPVQTLKQADLFRNYLDRRNRDVCKVTATMTVSNCQGMSINLTPEGNCRVPLTGFTTGGDQYERYGPDDNIFVQIYANTTRIITLPIPNVC